jgi:hypothetical protein
MSRTRIRGIDEPLPEGETLLWEGRPDARALARHAFRIRWIAGYFLALAGLAVITGGPNGSVVPRVAWLALLGGTVIGMAALYARLTAASTVYAVTDRRIVMKVGVAFPAVFNLPFVRVGGAEARTRSDGTGDVAFEVAGEHRIGFIFLWPHTRPWRIGHPQPMFRSIPDAERVAALVRDALLDAGVGTTPVAPSAPVEYRVLDDDGIVVLSNRSPAVTSEVS